MKRISFSPLPFFDLLALWLFMAKIRRNIKGTVYEKLGRRIVSRKEKQQKRKTWFQEGVRINANVLITNHLKHEKHKNYHQESTGSREHTPVVNRPAPLLSVFVRKAALEQRIQLRTCSVPNKIEETTKRKTPAEI